MKTDNSKHEENIASESPKGRKRSKTEVELSETISSRHIKFNTGDEREDVDINPNENESVKGEEEKIKDKDKSEQNETKCEEQKNGESQEGCESNNEEPPGEEEDPELTPYEKQEMYEAARAGDIDLLDDLLDKPGADINMEWFQENLLMTAIREEQEEMATFLVDNGINYNYTAILMDVQDEKFSTLDWYTVTCRQMAYDHGLFDLVQLIDQLNGDLWPFVHPPERVIRMKKTPEEKLLERLQKEEEMRKEIETEGAEENSIVVENIEGEEGKEDVIPNDDQEQTKEQADTGQAETEINKEDIEVESVHSSYTDESREDMGSKTPGSSCQRSPRLSHRFRETRSCIVRRSANHRNNNLQVTQPEAPTVIYGSYGAESKRWASPRRSKAQMESREEQAQKPSGTRTFSPWKNNDPYLESTYRKRVLSARTNRLRGSDLPVDSPLLLRSKSSLPSIGLRKVHHDTFDTKETRAVRTCPTYARVRNPPTMTFQEKISPRIYSRNHDVNMASWVCGRSNSCKQEKYSSRQSWNFNNGNRKPQVKSEEKRKYSPAGLMRTQCFKINTLPIKFATVLHKRL